MLCICSVPCSSVGKALKVGVQTPPMPKILLLKKGFLGKFELRLSRNLKRFTLQGNAKHDACIANSNVHVVCGFKDSNIYALFQMRCMHIMDGDKQFSTINQIAHW